jgi:hypothetical protein
VIGERRTSEPGLATFLMTLNASKHDRAMLEKGPERVELIVDDRFMQSGYLLDPIR